MCFCFLQFVGLADLIQCCDLILENVDQFLGSKSRYLENENVLDLGRVSD